MDNPDNGNHSSIETESEVLSHAADGSRRKTGRATDFNIHVGRLIRARRKQMRWSQEKLGGLVNRTFQQIQKYENGSNQISAALLLEISQTLGVPITYFYGDTPQSVSNDPGCEAPLLESEKSDGNVSNEFWRSVAKVIEYGRANPIIQASLKSALC